MDKQKAPHRVDWRTNPTLVSQCSRPKQEPAWGSLLWSVLQTISLQQQKRRSSNIQLCYDNSISTQIMPKTNDNFLHQKYDEISKKELIQQSDQDFYILYQLFRLFTFYKEHQNHTNCSLDFLRPAPGARPTVYDHNSHILRTLCYFNKAHPFGLGKIILPKGDSKEAQSYFYKSTIEEVEKFAEEKKDVGIGKQLQRFLDGERDIPTLFENNLWHSSIDGVLDYATIEITPTKKQRDAFLAYFLVYVEKFMSDELINPSHSSKVYFKYQKQIGILYAHLYKHLEDHSPKSTVVTITEILKGDDEKEGFSIEKSLQYSKFLPIHALAAMELQHIVEVEHISAGSLNFAESLDYYDYETQQSFELNGYRARITLDESFFEKIDASESDKETVIIDDEIGVYYESDISNAYPLKTHRKGEPTGRYKLLCRFAETSDPLTISDMYDIFESKNNSDISKQISAINSTFCKYTKRDLPLIEHLGTGGYQINKQLKLVKKLR